MDDPYHDDYMSNQLLYTDIVPPIRTNRPSSLPTNVNHPETNSSSSEDEPEKKKEKAMIVAKPPPTEIKVEHSWNILMIPSCAERRFRYLSIDFSCFNC